MIHNLLNLLCLIILGIIYIFTFAKVQNAFFSKISHPKNQATIIVYIASISAACVNLIHISDAASDAMLFFLDHDSLIKGIFYSLAFFTSAWVFSFLFFRASFFIVGSLTPENEVDELIKNNKEIAWLHALIIVALTFVISPALSKIATSFIPYPALPF
ncbi:MAG: hypothetical protein KJS45_10220 [Bacteroidetes bacterium]|nr:hypothetical protein [Bacteroidota bacterium]